MNALKSRARLKAPLIVGIILLLIITSSSKPAYSYRMSEYKPPSAAAGLDPRPLNIEVSAQNKSVVYFTEEYTGRIGAMKIAGDQRKFVEYILPFKPELGYSEPWDLSVVAPGNNSDLIFFTDYHQNQIGCLDDHSRKVWVWDIPTLGSGPRGIFAVNEKLVWFTEFYGDRIGKLLRNSTGWFIEEYNLPSGSNPVDIVCSGDAVWFTEYSRNRIGMINATTGTLYEYYIVGSGPWGITMDPDGMVWYTVSGGSGYIGRLNPWTREAMEHKGLPTSYSQPRDIAIDNYTRTVWFTEFTGHKVGFYRPGENLFYEFPTLTPSSSPSSIALLRKNPNATLNVFFTEWSGNKIGHLYYGGSTATYGETTTIIATQLTSAMTNTRLIATLKPTATTTGFKRVGLENIALVSSSTASEFQGTTTVKTDTAYRLSTSTMGTSTSYITEVVHTSTTSTSTSYKYISTVSLTSTNITVSTSTSYVATSSITYTPTFHETVYTSTMSLTQTSTVSRTDTLTTTVYHTKYKSTTSATTTT
ncbi:MAG: hypothetical protein QXE79_01455, partial [Candidatus Bathyarchaeia archaeon]